ncbi:MAG: sigma 54-interacting transcriptional regulator [Verrucomicrobiales bacterium]|nr:sigma 54-interacting transcriptional regulator [Verrucomicrobiales bacterium]
MTASGPRRVVVFGTVGNVLDSGFHQQRWSKWRPTVSLGQHEDLLIHRFELWHPPKVLDLARCVAADLARVSPETEVRLHAQDLKDPWDFEEVFGALHAWAGAYPFDPSQEDYLVHITTGTHVQQICLFLLTESRHFPARLVQTSPAAPRARGPEGVYRIIDLDLSRYDRIAARFRQEATDARALLKSGIATRNAGFNTLIEQIEHVALHSRDPILFTGPTGSGKSQLARRVYELRRGRHQVSGPFVAVNCATLRGDAAMSALFGHVKGAFTGAVRDRAGLLRQADGGVLFLDEIGELGLDEQAMLLRALEDRRFVPFGGDAEVSSDFLLLCGTNRDLGVAVDTGRFREDLLARINLWTFRLPALVERLEDLEPNLDYELDQFAARQGTRVTLSLEAREAYLAFARSPGATWRANFRDLNASLIRLATLAPGGRITREGVAEEERRLRALWHRGGDGVPEGDADSVLTPAQRRELDPFDRVQLEHVLRVCRASGSLSEAGRALFRASRARRRTPNDADRLGKYLARYGLDWETVSGRRASPDPRPV